LPHGVRLGLWKRNYSTKASYSPGVSFSAFSFQVSAFPPPLIQNSKFPFPPDRTPAQAERNCHHPDAHPALRQQRQTSEVMIDTAIIRRALIETNLDKPNCILSSSSLTSLPSALRAAFGCLSRCARLCIQPFRPAFGSSLNIKTSTGTLRASANFVVTFPAGSVRRPHQY